ncbi:MAG TPA: hypothetical protein VH478_06235 [Trebonia sp.]|nr:hypothetical protein [Trebonia sp.]
MQMRGYSRRQVDDFVARRNSEIRELEQRLARSLDETEHLRREVTTARQQALAGRPAHEEVSERIAQILKLADDEAKAQKGKADDDIAQLRGEAQQDSERVRADAREQAERMLTAAQEQAERTISAARNEADKTRTSARDEAERLTSETRKKSDTALANAKAQAKKVLDEATARAAAIHDGAERRLNLLSARHTETVRRLADILDGVQGLVAAENARMTLEEEVNAQTTKAIAMAEAAEGAQQAAQPAEPHEDEFSPADLALLAPPAPETAAGGPPPLARHREGANGGQVHGATPLGGLVQAPPRLGGPSLPPPPPAPSPSMAGFPPPGVPARHGIPAPDGPAMPPTSPASPADRDQERDFDRDRDRDFDPLRDPIRDGIRSTGTIDPDEPTEGIRLMP